MSTTTVEVESRGAVAVVTINRPESGNALSLEVGMDLMAAALTCSRNPSIRAVVLTGAGKNFCFGGDLRSASSRGTAVDAHLRAGVLTCAVKSCFCGGALGWASGGGRAMDASLRELTPYLHSAQSQF